MNNNELACVFRWHKEVKTTYFYSNTCKIPEPVKEDDVFGIRLVRFRSKRPKFESIGTSESDSDFIENYGNPLASIQINRTTVVVEKGNDKVSLKVFSSQKWRDVGRPYFRKSQRIYFLTYNLKTNDLFYGRTANGPTKKHRVHEVRRNYFSFQPANTIMAMAQDFIKSVGVVNDEAKEISQKAMISMLSEIPNLELEQDVNTPDFILFKHYIRARNIKAPNNLAAFQSLIPIPKPRTIKKCGNKWVEAIMATHGLCGGKVLRILHEVENVNLRLFNSVKDFFGEKFIAHQDANDIRIIFESRADIGFPSVSFTDKERSNAFSVLMSIIKSDSGNSLMSFADHLRFYATISEFEKIVWKSIDLSSFELEHLDWSDKVYNYTVGHYTREYDQKLINIFETPIVVKQNERYGYIEQKVYYPVILKTTQEYNEESSVQSHCVKTYLRSASIIISLRAESVHTKDRVTVELIPSITFNDRLILRRSQTLGRFNKKPDTEWDSVIDVLDNRIAIVNETGLLMGSIQMAHKVRGGEIIYTLGATKNGNPTWVSDVDANEEETIIQYDLNFF